MHSIVISRIVENNRPLSQWQYKGVVAKFAIEEECVILVSIESPEWLKGTETVLIASAKLHYGKVQKRLVGTPTLNKALMLIYKKLGVEVI